MDCPVCKIPMLVVEKNDVELDHCVQCGGTWFDRSEVDYLLRSIDFHIDKLPMSKAPPSALRGEKPRTCPVCRKPMSKMLVGDADSVMIDRCVRHEGYWFDRDELEPIVKQNASTGEWARVSKFVGGVISSKPENSGQD